MRIYPDPELPDVVIEWFPEIDCGEDTDRVVVSLFTVDPAAEVSEVEVPCQDAGARFDDVARLRYRLSAKLEDPSGAVLGGHDTDIDLRDGLNERVTAFFGRSPTANFSVSWTFDMGSSCESLSATTVLLRATLPGGDPFFFDAPCDEPLFLNAIPLEGTFTITARAVAGGGAVVAASPESAPFTITRNEIADLGTIVMSPCGAACPPF